MQKAKTKQEIADEYHIHRNTLYNWLKKADIKLSSRLVSPKEQLIIYDKFGNPNAKTFE